MRRRRTLADPLMEVRLFTERAFAGTLLLMLGGVMVTSGVTLFGMSVVAAAGAVVSVALAVIAVRVLRRVPPVGAEPCEDVPVVGTPSQDGVA
ncbi:hypothetical protein AB0B50_20505 [Streptomyces sp. NPDC041068]|uniref:hypothetical protein n=1 Tax=Streptomyces sp. NPDC041068 TaxID=3155130 RepID=UPI0033EAEC20